jgi:predicted GNAT family N-acyltransferase
MNANLEVTCPTSPIQTGSDDPLNSIYNEWTYQNSIVIGAAPHLVPRLLTDTSRLKEIYELRVDVWERSGNCEFVNRALYPNGWSDELDKTALHWVITNVRDEIIAAARLNIFNSLDDFPYYSSMKHLPFPAAMPFAFLSRLIVHPDYRQKGLSRKLAYSRMLFCKKKNINWFQVLINNKRIIHLFEKMNYRNIGQANVSYHQFSEPHSVNVFIRHNNIINQ